MADVAQHQTRHTSDHRNIRLRDVPFSQWRRIVAQTARDLWAGSILEWSSSLAFYAFLSLFPLLIAILIVASYIVDAAWATERATDFLGRYLPEGGEEIGSIIESAVAERRRIGVLSFVILLFTGRRVLGVLTKGLNHVSDVDEQDDRLGRRIGVELSLVLGLVALGFLILAAPPLVDFTWHAIRIVPGSDGFQVTVVAGALRMLLLLAIFTLVYAYVPRGERIWRAVLIGAGTATALFVIAEGAFGMAGDRIRGNLTLIYGPLALAAILLSWAWYVAVITLVCGGFASHIKVMIFERGSAKQARQEHVHG